MFFVVPNRFLGMANWTYDYQLWIDSDIIFNPNKFWELCDLANPADGEEKEITCGWYATEDGHTTSVAHYLRRMTSVRTVVS